MAGLDALVIRGERQLLLQQGGALQLGILEMAGQTLDIGMLEIMGGIFALGAQEDVAVGDAAAVEIEVVDPLDVLHIHRQAFEAIGHLKARQHRGDAANLLEIGELPHLHAVAPDFPAQAPGAEGRAFPIILDEAEIMQAGVEPDLAVALQEQILRRRRARLHDHLILVIMLEPVGVFAIAPIGGAARRLNIGRLPGFFAQGAQGGGGVEGAGAHLNIIGLQDHAALTGPKSVQTQDHFLKAWCVPH